jgi:bacillithiol system protein YtxJ
MHREKIETIAQLNEADALSHRERVFVFKFTPGCPIDIIVNLLLGREWNRNLMNMKIYMVNPAINKDISDKISEQYNIMHHSPQCLIIENGKCIYSQSNGKIRFSELKHFANRVM